MPNIGEVERCTRFVQPDLALAMKSLGSMQVAITKVLSWECSLFRIQLE